MASESDNKLPRGVAAQAADGLMAQDSHEVRQVADGVWAGQGVTADGEPIYFGLKLFGPDNIGGWCTAEEENPAQHRIIEMFANQKNVYGL